MFEYLKALRCIYLHKSFSYDLPSAGKYLIWDCSCIKCGHQFKIKKPNTPRWVSPVRFDKTRPESWDEWTRQNRPHLTTNPSDPRLGHGADETQTPQQEVYLVLSEDERKKGFIRPYRESYKHIGSKPKYPLRDLSDEEKERYEGENYVKFEIYPDSMLPRTGKFWTQKQLDQNGCGTVTKMGRDLSETYARNPHFYGATYCVGCQMHRPVAEFVWVDDGEVVGS